MHARAVETNRRSSEKVSVTQPPDPPVKSWARKTRHVKMIRLVVIIRGAPK